jgi:hypothetical protein
MVGRSLNSKLENEEGHVYTMRLHHFLKIGKTVQLLDVLDNYVGIIACQLGDLKMFGTNDKFHSC